MTTSPLLFISTACVVTALAWGYNDLIISNGYISAGVWTASTNNRGFNIALLNVTSCSVSSTMTFDTYLRSSKSIDLANYINSLPISTILVGVTADEAIRYLETNGKAALNSIGANVNGLLYRGKVAFVAQIGQQSATLSRTAAPGGNNVQISVTIRGNT